MCSEQIGILQSYNWIIIISDRLPLVWRFTLHRSKIVIDQIHALIVLWTPVSAFCYHYASHSSMIPRTANPRRVLCEDSSSSSFHSIKRFDELDPSLLSVCEYGHQTLPHTENLLRVHYDHHQVCSSQGATHSTGASNSQIDLITVKMINCTSVLSFTCGVTSRDSLISANYVQAHKPLNNSGKKYI